MVLKEETKQKPRIFFEEKRKGNFPFLKFEVIGNCAFPLSFHGENSDEILIFFAVKTSDGLLVIILAALWIFRRMSNFDSLQHSPKWNSSNSNEAQQYLYTIC